MNASTVAVSPDGKTVELQTQRITASGSKPKSTKDMEKIAKSVGKQGVLGKDSGLDMAAIERMLKTLEQAE